MAYLESHTVLSRHRKVKELARSLRLKPVYVMGHLHALWHDALEQQEDGDLTKWSDEMVADSSQFDGDAPQYVSLLQLHGWLDGRLIHDWLDYAGPYLVSKYHTNKRQWLVDVWAKHGKEYGKRKQIGSEQEVNGQSREDKKTLDKKRLETPTSTPAPQAASKRFVKPSAEEVTAYGKTIAFSVDGSHFCDHYESKGWKVGNTPMKDWKAAVRTWKKNGYSSPAKPTFQQPAPYKFIKPDESELPMPSELKGLLSGLGKAIPK